MSCAGLRSRAGFTITELLVAVTIGLLAATIIVQTLVVTVRTTDMTSSQADTQAQTRRALAECERQMRDGWAILYSYTMQVYPYTAYTTQITSTRKTLVVALPSVDTAGVPCAWRGIPVVFDCIIWDAVKGANGLWTLSRLTFTNAFQMPVSYRDNYTVPTTFGRTNEWTPKVLFSGAADALQIRLSNDSMTYVAGDGTGITAPPTVTSTSELPYWVNSSGGLTTTQVRVTEASTVRISLQYSARSPALVPGGGQSIQSDVQTNVVRLRNKQKW